MKAPLRLGFDDRRQDGLLGRGSNASRLAAALALGVGLLAVALALAWSIRAVQQAREAEAALAQQQAQHQRKQLAKRPAQARPAVEPWTAEALRQADAGVDRLNQPWPALMALIERHSPPRAALLSLKADADAGRVTLLWEAASLDELLAAARRFEADPDVASVQLTHHEPRATDVSTNVSTTVRLTLAIVPAVWAR